MNRMVDTNFADAQSVIAEFLLRVREPLTNDWDELLSQFPQFANEIVNTALILKAGCLSEEDYETESPESSELFTQTVSLAINLAYAQPSPQLKEVQEKIASCRGPAIRSLCTDLAISHAPLLNGVLAGTISPPSKLLRRLAERLESPVAALREIFSQSFAAREVPAYKSDGAKPSVSTQPTSWEDAVRSLKLPNHETKSLLSWNDEGR